VPNVWHVFPSHMEVTIVRRLAAALLAGLLTLGIVAGPASASSKTIADIAVGNPDFSTLVAALSCTGLVPAVADPEARLTVFAPTNAAFRKFGLTERNVCRLPKKLLTNILTYHVAPGTLSSSDVLGARKIKMLNGQSTFPSVRHGKAYINWYARITATDIAASNGVIHVIDSVLIPYRLF
jgi:uncharacterized surface protein with fasciclin (FAS1) repeats